jgi:hypothetical protein
VAVAVPSVAVQPAPISPRIHQSPPGPFHGRRKELVRLGIGAPEHRLLAYSLPIVASLLLVPVAISFMGREIPPTRPRPYEPGTWPGQISEPSFCYTRSRRRTGLRLRLCPRLCLGLCPWPDTATAHRAPVSNTRFGLSATLAPCWRHIGQAREGRGGHDLDRLPGSPDICVGLPHRSVSSVCPRDKAMWPRCPEVCAPGGFLCSTWPADAGLAVRHAARACWLPPASRFSVPHGMDSLATADIEMPDAGRGCGPHTEYRAHAIPDARGHMVPGGTAPRHQWA